MYILIPGLKARIHISIVSSYPFTFCILKAVLFSQQWRKYFAVSEHYREVVVWSHKNERSVGHSMRESAHMDGGGSLYIYRELAHMGEAAHMDGS